MHNLCFFIFHPDPNAMRVINSRGFQPTVRVGAIYYIRYREKKTGRPAGLPALDSLIYATLFV